MDEQFHLYERIISDFINLFSVSARNPLAKDIDHTLGRYTEKGRFYHTQTHLLEMAYMLSPYQQGMSDKDLFTAIGFIIFHDAIYSTKTMDDIQENENRSAELAGRVLHAHIRQGDQVGRWKFDISDAVTHIETLIRASKHHEIDPQADPLGALLLDIDMAILAADRGRYKIYADQVRQEYTYHGLLTDSDFMEARSTMFLKAMLDKPRIFLTDHFETTYADQARDNMRWEIEYSKERKKTLNSWLQQGPRRG